MTIVKYIAILLSGLWLMSACSDDTKTIFNPDNVTSKSLNELTSSSFTLLEENKSKEFQNFKWEEFDFGYQAAITYVLQADLAGKNFESAQTLGFTKEQTLSISVETINNMVLTLIERYGLSADDSQQIEFRIKATPADDKSDLYVTTNVVTAEITSYQPKVIYPTALYLMGTDFGDWNWDDSGVGEMIPVNGRVGEFWIIRYFKANNEFRWFPRKSSDAGGFNSKGTSVGFELTGENAKVTADGLYIVYVDYPNDKITIEAAKVYGMGDAFGGWNQKEYPFKINGQMMEITAPNNTSELRMYASSSATTADWWQMEFIVRNGIIEYRGNGNDQEPRVSIVSSEKIILDFNKGLGTIN